MTDIDLPGPPYRTARLVLRPFTAADVREAHAALDTDPEVWAFDPGYARTPAQRGETIAHYAMLWEQFGFGPAGAWCAETGALVGQGGLNPYLYEHRDGSRTVEFEVMFKLARPFQGQGYATEIARFWAAFAFSEVRLPRLCTAPDRANRAAVAVLERLGCRFVDDWLDPDTVIGILDAPDRAAEDGIVPELCCTDVEASVGVYVSAFGFTVRYRREGFALLDREGIAVMLEQLETDSWLVAPAERPFGRGMNLEIPVSDIDALVAQATAAGRTPFLAPEVAWYRTDRGHAGQKQAIFADPDGYLLRFAQSLGRRDVPPEGDRAVTS